MQSTVLSVTNYHPKHSITQHYGLNPQDHSFARVFVLVQSFLDFLVFIHALYFNKSTPIIVITTIFSPYFYSFRFGLLELLKGGSFCLSGIFSQQPC